MQEVNGFLTQGQLHEGNCHPSSLQSVCFTVIGLFVEWQEPLLVFVAVLVLHSIILVNRLIKELRIVWWDWQPNHPGTVNVFLTLTKNKAYRCFLLPLTIHSIAEASKRVPVHVYCARTVPVYFVAAVACDTFHWLSDFCFLFLLSAWKAWMCVEWGQGVRGGGFFVLFGS